MGRLWVSCRVAVVRCGQVRPALPVWACRVVHTAVCNTGWVNLSITWGLGRGVRLRRPQLGPFSP